MKAAKDPTFLGALREQRSAAAEAAGISLSVSERAVLDSVPLDQLEKMVTELRAVDPVPFSPHREISRGIRPILPIAVAAAGTVVLGGAAASLLIVTGSRPDEPAIEQKYRDVEDAGTDGSDGEAESEPHR
jgi:hypothetical protein